jgi:hypothetical protein
MQRTISVTEATKNIKDRGLTRTNQTVRSWCRQSDGKLGKLIAGQFVVFPDALDLVLSGVHPADLPEQNHSA